ncbi:hypothetical protein [Streptomyces goshikiensis]|uniref:hypothetical protein n=1 Tax=Streptomyces goshikiensis TaxID=1942 RepID=UPI00339F2833
MDIAARQLTAGLDPPSRADQLAAVQAIRRASQPAVDELHQAVTLHVFYAVAESCNTGHRPAVAELGALPDDARWLAGWLADNRLPQAQAVERRTLTEHSFDLIVVSRARREQTEPLGMASFTGAAKPGTDSSPRRGERSS